MKRLLGMIVSVTLICAVVAFSNKNLERTDIRIEQGERNPWNHLQLNNDPADFQFAFVSDRTGGHREKIFSRAVEQINLLQPAFVISVGDLIEGGNRKSREAYVEEWKEFDGFIAKLTMPFFYVPGNHDITNPAMDKLWQERLGRRYYHFIYRNVLFLLLNSEDPPGVGEGRLGKEQIAFAKRVLEENPAVRWTVVAMHKPLWTAPTVENTGWLDVEKALAGRKYSVFVGHVHRYQKFVRNGMCYYQLATTGGGSKIRGARYGEFDHIAWVTMKKDGPVVANIMLDGVLPENLRMPETAEAGVSTAGRRKTFPVQGKVVYQGTPAANALVVFHGLDGGRRRIRADGLTEADGTFRLSTYKANDGVPPGDYAVTVHWRRDAYFDAGEVKGEGPEKLPIRYTKMETSGLRASVKEGTNELAPFELTK